MDPRLSLGLVSAAGAFLGAGIMIAWTPDTGSVAAPLAAEPAPAEAPAELAPEPSAEVPAAPAAPGADDWGLPADADNPFGAPPPGDNPFGEAPPPPRVNPNRPLAPGSVVPEGGPYPSDVRGIGQVFRDREAQVNDCMTKQGPAANPGEMAVMLRVRLEPDAADPSRGVVRQVEAVQDKESRYTYFLDCVTKVLADAPFNAPSGPQATVHWSVRR